MKKLVTLIVALVLGIWVMAQTPVGTGQTYVTVKDAFDAINNGTLTGAVVLQLVSSTSETASAVLNASGTGGANYSSVTIYPTGSGYTVSGSIAGALIQLNGADNVVIDGRVNQAGSMDLSISNTSTGGQVIEFINDATYNTVQYCNIMGVTSSVTSGVIVFTTTTGSLGNSNNTITYCDIHDGATTPANLVYASGTAGILNSNNTVSYCNLYNWFTAATTSQTSGIYLRTSSSDWTITGNSFYQTVSRTYTSTGINSCLAINNTTNGVNFTVTGNYFGGSAPNCGSTPMTLIGSGNAIYRLLYITHSVGAASTISGNTFQNISMSTPSASTALSLISHLNGNVNILNNTFGVQNGTGNITMTNTGTSTSPFFMVLNSGTGTTASNVEFSGNNIGGITVSSTGTGSTQFRTVYSQAPVGSSIKFDNNIIGGSVSNSLQQNCNSSAYGIMTLSATTGILVTNNEIRNLTRNNTGNAAAGFAGIYVAAAGGNHTISGNVIHDLTTNSSITSINNNASVVGITMTATGVGGTKVTGNTIYNLTNTNNTLPTWINGMYFATAAAPQPQTVIAGNLIYGINLAFNNSGMGGIFVPNTGNAMIYNNVVRLGYDASNNPITTPLEIYGIWKASTANVSVYHNSVLIGGSGVTGPAAEVSVAYVSTQGSTADTVMNNIFYNARSNGTGDGTHYGMYLYSVSGLVCDYNDIFTDGTGGFFGSDNVLLYTNLPSWQSGTLLDANSISANPLYTSTSNLLLQNASPAIGMAYKLAQVPTDYPGNTRGPVTSMGAYELVGPTSPSSLTWTGAVSENWHNPYNWNGTSEIPNATTNVVIPTGVPNYPTLQRNGWCNNYGMLSDATGTATLLDNSLLTIGGAASVQRYFSGNDIDWHLISSPVSNETSNVFLAMYLQSFSEATNSYTEITPTTDPLNVMEGYGVYSTLGAGNTVTFNGTLNLGNQSAGFTATNQGWNLLGNPFVSSIDWEAVTIPSGLSNEVHYIDAATGNDLSYVQGVGGTGSQYIPPMQGFFVSATTAGTLAVGDAERTHSGGSNFYKSGTDQLLILEAAGENYSDQTWIHFNTEAGVEHDGIYDAYKRISESNPELPQIFSYTEQGTRLSVNGIPETLTVPVGFRAVESGIFTISAIETGLFNNVVLEDLATGVFTDLMLTAYTFDYEAGSVENRFIVHFTPLGTGSNITEAVNIYAYGNVAYVNVPENTKGMIRVFNLMGQEVTSAPLNNTLNSVSLPAAGSYLVKVTTNGKVYTQKINIQ